MKNIIFSIRAKIMRWLFPTSSYFRAPKNVHPLSRKFGFDRGKPIDRFWIESYLEEKKNLIHGICMEIGSDTYTKQFGSNITRADVLDVVPRGKSVKIIGDLRNLKGVVKDNTYDCIVLTHVIGMIDDLPSAVSEVKRILKPGGVVIVTVACFGPLPLDNIAYWRITPKGLRYLFEGQFGAKNINTKMYGNALTGQYFWIGMSQEELTLEELTYNDPEFPCIACLTAYKDE